MAVYSGNSGSSYMKLVSYNNYMHGFNQGRSLLVDLCSNFDIIFCQEHWLSPDFLFKLSDVATDFVFFSVTLL